VEPGRGRTEVRDTGRARAENGGLAVSGSLAVAGDVVLGSRPGPRRSGYLLEVAELAAEDFRGRETELAGMAAFCTGAAPPDGPRYWRWLAPAWSGKTALMARFALHPPRELDVLAFFITARAAGRSDRTAFLAAMEGQLREYLSGGDVECGSKGQFLDALERAAAQAVAAGRRLVLLVDGLDEDTGVLSANSGHSVAALLPRVPPEGVSVVVAGRPNPPVPSDVHENHPLHDRRIDRTLTESEAARAVRQVAERDLNTLLGGGGHAREIAQLVAAAEGGLSAADLAALLGLGGADVTARDVLEVLGGALGRSFQCRPAQWPRAGEPAGGIIAFAHEELQRRALGSVSAQTLGAHHERLHRFAGRWAAAGWPEETPEYALFGYPQLLRRLGDVDRTTALATDAARQELLWRTTGSDAQAFAEIAGAFRLLLAAGEPDPAVCARLAHRRDTLRAHAGQVPDILIIAWARLGQVRRALAVAPLAQVARGGHEIFARVFRAAGGDPDTGALAVSAVRTLTDPEAQGRALVPLVKEFAAAGRPEEAAALARGITVAGHRESALAFLARAGAAAGVPDQGRPDPVPDRRVPAAREPRGPGPVSLRHASVTAERRARAAELARTGAHPRRGAPALAALAHTLAGTEHRSQAEELAQEAAELSRSGPSLSGEAARLLARALAGAGLIPEAPAVARTIAAPYERALALADVVRHSARAGGDDESADTVREATRAARAPADGHQRVRALAALAQALAAAGRNRDAARTAREAVRLARMHIGPSDRARVLVALAKVLAAAGRHEEAADLARTIAAPYPRAQALRATAEALARTGRHDEAAELAHTITEPDQRPRALAALARMLTTAGRREEALDVVRTITDRGWRARALTAVLEAAESAAEQGPASTGPLVVEAAGLAAGLENSPFRQAQVLAALARMHATAGRQEDAAELFGKACAALRKVPAVGHRDDRAEALTALAKAAARLDRVDELLELARSATDAPVRARGLATVAVALAGTGARSRAAEPAREAAECVRTAGTLLHRDLGLREVVVRALARAGRTGEAADEARRLPGADARAGALADVASRCGTAEEKRALIAEALSTGFWARSLKPLAESAPEALRALAGLVAPA
jgi:tetratricopeptide (TPR) repeat protein